MAAVKVLLWDLVLGILVWVLSFLDLAKGHLDLARLQAAQLDIAQGHLDIAQGHLNTVPFVSVEVRNYLQCKGLCAKTSQCHGKDYNYKTRECSLYTRIVTTDGTSMAKNPPLNIGSERTGVCDTKPCKNGELCLLTESGHGFLCLQLVDCGDPSDLGNMTVDAGSVTSSTFNSSVRYSCKVGYRKTTGDGLSVCQETGLWTEPSLKCEMVDCGDPSDLGNMAVDAGSVTSSTFNSGVIYSCKVGYRKTTGDGLSVCQETGLWTEPSLKCELVDCGNPSDLGNMTVDAGSVTSSTFNSSVRYSCKVGYRKTTGDGLGVCQETGLWTEPSLKCELVDCGDPSDLGNMTVDAGSVTSSTFNSSVRYSCKVGYRKTTGDGLSVCQETGLWTEPSLKCELVDCGNPSDLGNMTVDAGSVTSSTFNSGVRYSCKVGYRKTTGDGLSVCQETGLWTEPSLKCELVDCGNPSDLGNMAVDAGSVTSSTFNSSVRYSCKVGYRKTTGDGLSVCQETGLWTEPSLKCELVDCGNPSDLGNMAVDAGSLTSSTFNSSVRYSCKVGYRKTTGDGLSVCQETGLWTEPSLKCERVECGLPTDIPGMTYGDVTYTSSKLTVTYECDLGYTGYPWVGESECLLVDGIWTRPNFNCRAIHNLIGTATSTSSDSTLSCMSKHLTWSNSPLGCDHGYVLTGCSVTVIDSSEVLAGGVEIVKIDGTVSCALKSANVKGIVRCCRAQCLECEYIWGYNAYYDRRGRTHLYYDLGTNEANVAYCKKDFKIVGCSGYAKENQEIIGISTEDTKCTVFSHHFRDAVVNAACCRAPSLTCVRQFERNVPGDLRKSCPNDGTMTGCSAKSSKGSYIEETESSVTCVAPRAVIDDVVHAMCCSIKLQ